MNAPPRFSIFSLLTFGLLAMTLVAATGCHSVPMTGRKQVLLLSENEEANMGAQAFEQTLTSEQPSQNPQYVAMVERVGQRLAAVAERPDFAWEFRVIQSPEQNAFCLPGGKVAVYEGILPICQTEAGLAVVMAHEVAHALARHGAERVSHGYLVDGLGKAVNMFAQKQPSSTAIQKVAQSYGVASNYGFVLPYSRKHESEADEIGIMLMAKAGYDPSEAPRFWQRFAQIKTGDQPPEFMSTHPSDERRASDLDAQLAAATALYAQVPQKFGMGEQLVFGAPSAMIAAQPVPTATSAPTPTATATPTETVTRQPPTLQTAAAATTTSTETRKRMAIRAAQYHEQQQARLRQLELQAPVPPSPTTTVRQASATEPVRPTKTEFGKNPFR